FQHPEDAREQLKRGQDLHQQVFGVRPAGVWPSEGSVSEEVLAIAHRLGVNWMATDEGVLGRTLGVSFWRDGSGRLPPDQAGTLYDMYRYDSKDAELQLLFREQPVSGVSGCGY